MEKQSGGFSFGQPASLSASPSSPSTSSSNTSSSSSSSTSSTGFSFGNPAPATAISTTSPATPTATSGFSFGQPVASSTPTPSSSSSSPSTSSSGFSFGNPAPATATSTTSPATSGFSFGRLAASSTPTSSTSSTSSPSTSSSGFSFGNVAPAATSSPAASPSAGWTFGGSSSTSSPSTSAPSTSGFSFGTPATTAPETKQPAGASDIWDCPTCMVPNKKSDLSCVCCETDQPGVAPATSSSFGSSSPANTAPATTGFGAPAPSFGTTTATIPAAAPSSPSPGFGAAPPATSSFGTAAPAALTFGAPVASSFGTTSPATGFGATATPSFGTTIPAVAPLSSSSGFGAAPPATSSFGTAASTFGAPAASTFGAPAASSSTTVFGSVSTLGAPATTGFGTARPSPFGAPRTAFGAPTSIFGAAATTPATSLFGAPAAPTTAATTGFGSSSAFGTSTTTAPATGGLGLGASPSPFGAPVPTPAPSFGLPLSTKVSGTAAAKYAPSAVQEGITTIHLFSISSQPQYSTKNAEELRLEDYQESRKGVAVSAATTTGRFSFGTTPTSTTSFPAATGFGTFLGGSTSTTGFGSSTPGTGFFYSAPATSIFAPAPARTTNPSLFSVPKSDVKYHFITTFSSLAMMDQKTLSDIELVIESEGERTSLHLHKLILCAGSELFRKELGSKASYVINLDTLLHSNKDGEPSQRMKTFKHFIRTLYGESFSVAPGSLAGLCVSDPSKVREIVDIYRLSAHFKVSTLRDGLEDVFHKCVEPVINERRVYSPETSPPKILKGKLTPVAPPADEFLALMTHLVIPVLMTAIISRSTVFQAVLSQLFTSLDWVLLHHQDYLRNLDSAAFVEIFSDDFLCIEDEYVVFDCATRWLECNKNVDEEKIMATIRFPHVSPARLTEIRGTGLLSTAQYIFCLEAQALREKDSMGLSLSKPAKEDSQHAYLSLEIAPRKLQRYTEIDLVIVCDNTSSMTAEIESVKATAADIIQQISKKCKGSVRFALVSYRDHTDDYVTKSYDFTSSTEEACQFVASMAAFGGADTPEALDEALDAVTKLSFRPNALKYAILIADAGPHGIGYAGDRYPGGSPAGLDWLEVCGTLSEMKVVFFACVSERSITDDKLVLFMDTVAKKTSGKCLRLQDAAKLPDVIINGTLEDIDLAQVIKKEISGLDKEKSSLSNEEIVKEIKTKLSEMNFVQRQLNSHVFSHSNSENVAKAGKMTNETKAFFGFGSTSSAPSTASFGSGSAAFGSAAFGSASESSIASKVSLFRSK